VSPHVHANTCSDGLLFNTKLHRNLGELLPYETQQYPLKLLPLVAGLHEVKGCTVVDMQTAQEYTQPKLADVFVEA
jgi:hypothetical protein